MDWISILQVIGGIISGIGIGFFTKSGRVKAKADALKAMTDAYETRITALHSNIEIMNNNEKELSERVAELNHGLNEKSDQIREITERKQEIADRLYASERETNRVNTLLDEANKRIITLTEERDEERRKKEYYRNWRCEKSVCFDPKGRRPPNARLANEKYVSPE